ncbi:MAG: hypothetical protein IIB64_10010 [Proteobacteria bacterium]|nr:hypothetical protein [Pseudomonadota bacterium]
MKKLFLTSLIFSTFCLYSQNAFSDILLPPLTERTLLHQDEVFNYLEFGYSKEILKGDAFLIDAWGYENPKVDNGKVIENEIFIKIILNPWLSSNRVWRAYLITHKIEISEADKQGFCLKEISKCSSKSYPFAFVIPNGQDLKSKNELTSNDFFWIKSQIEETRLVWLIDFLEKMKQTPVGKIINVKEIYLKHWPESQDHLFLLEKLQERDSNYRIYSVNVDQYEDEPAGYVVEYCPYSDKLKTCDILEEWIGVRVFFKTNNEVFMKFIRIVF